MVNYLLSSPDLSTSETSGRISSVRAVDFNEHVRTEQSSEPVIDAIVGSMVICGTVEGFQPATSSH